MTESRAHTPATDELEAWLALVRAPGFGPQPLAGLLQRNLPPTALLREPGLAAELGLPPAARRWLQQPDRDRIEADLRWAEQDAAHVIPLTDPAYPPLLREIPDPPPVLFVVGNPEWLRFHHLAIVGSRNPTPYGRGQARGIARQLGRGGLSITSGLARGIDAEAHRAALAVGAPTLAVMGTGPDLVYPARHRDLAHQIAERGALVTEFPPGSPPRSPHFPRRNRVIAGLSLGVLVVEAALRSGSLITARHAMEQGREVFAVPGSVTNPLARGCHALIRQGAKLVENGADVLEELGPLAGANHRLLLEEPDPAPAAAEDPLLDPDHQRVLAAVEDFPTAVDEIVARSGLTPEEVSSILLILELGGHVCASAGGKYSRSAPTRG